MKKLISIILVSALLLSFSGIFSGAVGTTVKEKELFVAPKAERVLYDALDKVVNALVGAIAAIMPVPPSWKQDIPEGFMQGSGKFLTEPSENACWYLGYDKRSLLPEDKNQVIGKYYVAGTISVSGKMATAVEDDLLVRTSAISDGEGRPVSVFAAIDSYGMSLGDVREIRQRLSRWCLENNVCSITVSALHQHSAIDTFGMNGDIWHMALLNPPSIALGLDTVNGKDPEYMENLFLQCTESIKAAVGNMKKGELYFGTADAEKYINDKRQPYINDPNFNRFRFVPSDGSRETWLVTSSIHCVGNGASGTVITGDYPYYAEEVINTYGADVMFLMGAEACNNQDRNKSTVVDYSAQDTALSHTKGYGKAIGKDITEIKNEKKIEPLLNIRYKEIVLPVDNSILLFAGKAGLFENIIKKIDGRFCVVTELGYMEMGKDIAFGIIPGELSPEIAYGGCLTAEYAWTSQSWDYPSLQETVQGRDLYIIGLANDQIGYIVPDNNYMSMLHEDSKSIEFVSLGKHTASQIVKEFQSLVKE